MCSRYQQNVVPDARRRFSRRREPSSWADSLERFRSHVRSLSSAWVKGTGSGLYAPHSAVSVMSLDSESELDSMVTFGSRTRRSGSWGTGLNMVLVLAIDAF